jgi:pimeloyl-ACP methyl ester carboxylesterase
MDMLSPAADEDAGPMPEVRTDAGTIFFREKGDGDPLLLIMGAGADHTSWARQIPVLARHFRVIAPDNRGSGRSGPAPPPDATPATFAKDALRLLDALGAGPFHVAGYSFGAAIAMELALGAGNRVRSASFHAGWAGPNPVTTAVLGQSLAAARTGGVAAYLEAACRRNLSPGFRRSPAFPSFLENVLGSASRPTPEGLVAQTLAGLAHDARARLPGLRLRTLVTSGEHDPVAPPHVAEEIASLVPGSRLHVFRGPRAWHAIPLEMADELNALLVAFHGASLPASG